MTGAEYIAEFLARVGCRRVYTLTGGACAFMVDAVSRLAGLEYVCMQHEQAAAMAADAVWRVSRRLGVTVVTSGPGATNLITGIACSYFDSIPSLHITGQVNQAENRNQHGGALRQSGFQETRIVEMVAPITKHAVTVRSGEELRQELAKAYQIALSERMGPVLIDVPMDVQQAPVDGVMLLPSSSRRSDAARARTVAAAVSATLADARRPVVLVGGGVGLAGSEAATMRWLRQTGLPFVTSWAGLQYVDHDGPGFLGQIGVYGNRGANFVVQNADAVIVLGSRLDNRQRSGAADTFAAGAVVHVLDIDDEELRKFDPGRYRTDRFDLGDASLMLTDIRSPPLGADWLAYVGEMKARYYGKEVSGSAARLGSLSPYEVVRRIGACIADDAVVVGDTGAAVCWLHQGFRIKRHSLFTAGGNSPMGYALPAAIGAKLEAPERQVVSYNGDGGFQLNLQELQVVRHHELELAIVIMNNAGYGIIKQFQDSNLDGRYAASKDGYSTPDFGRIASAYGLRYVKVMSIDQLTPELFRGGAIVIDVQLSEHTLIEPKLEMGRPINDQFPYLPIQEYDAGNRYVAYPRSEKRAQPPAPHGGAEA